MLTGRHADDLEKPSSSMTRVDTREVSGGWKNLHNQELHYLSLSLNANKVFEIKQGEMHRRHAERGRADKCTCSYNRTAEAYACVYWIRMDQRRVLYNNDTDQLSDYHLLKIS